MAPFEIGISIWRNVIWCAMRWFINGEFGSST
jgi:hypothetical protein